VLSLKEKSSMVVSERLEMNPRKFDSSFNVVQRICLVSVLNTDGYKTV